MLLALQDVENALVAYVAEQQHRRRAGRTRSTANRRAVDLSTRLYSAGRDRLPQRPGRRSASLLASEDALVQSDRNVAANLVALYKALGGGWDESAGE